MTKFNQTDEVALKRRLLILLLAAIAVFSAWFGVSRNLPIIGLLIPAVAIFCGLFSRPVLIFILAQFAIISRLTAPGFTTSISLPLVIAALLIGWALLDVAVRKQKRPYSYRADIDKWLWVFVLNILLIIAVRGSGLSFMGGSVYGGAAYMGIGLSIFYYFSLVRIQLSERDIKQLLLIGVAGACIPMAVEILLYVREGAAIGLTKYVGVVAGYSLATKNTSQEVIRWSSFSALGAGLIVMAFVLCTQKIYKSLLIGLGVLLVALTGFRGALGSTGVLIVWLSIYFSKNRMKTFVLLGFLGLFGFGILAAAAPMLPSGIQRAVSFIPGISVSREVTVDSEASTNWRVEMWRDYCIPALPKYLLVGRGLSRDITAYAWLDARWYETAEFFYHMGSYHSGPFNLLLNYGLAGTISFTLFFVLTIIDGWRTVRRYASRRDSLLAKYYGYLTVRMTWSVVSFYLIFGDVAEGLLPMLIIAAQMRILKKNFLMEASGADVKPVERSNGLPPSLKPVNRWAPRPMGRVNQRTGDRGRKSENSSQKMI